MNAMKQPKQRKNRRQLALETADQRHATREKFFSRWIDFGELEHVANAVYKNPEIGTVLPKGAVNTPTLRVNVTNLAFGITTELFVFTQAKRLIKVNKDDYLLDVGCGEPSLFEMCSDSMFFPNYVGIDIRSQALKEFGNSRNLIAVQDDIIKTKAIKDHSAKLIVFSEVLEHLKKKQGIELLRNIKRWLKKDGRVVITVPIRPEGVELNMKVEESKWGHLYYYEKEELAETLDNVGLEMEQMTFGRFFTVRSGTVKAALVKAEGKAGENVWNHLSLKLPLPLLTSMFIHYAGDVGGSMQVIARHK